MRTLGETVSGVIRNWGWALTPSTRLRDSGNVEMVFSNGVLFDPTRIYIIHANFVFENVRCS